MRRFVALTVLWFLACAAIAQQPSRFEKSGLTDSEADASKYVFHMLPIPVPGKHHVFFDDFNYYLASDWVVNTTEAGTSSASEAIQNATYGVLRLTNDTYVDDGDFLETQKELFYFVPNTVADKDIWLEARAKISASTEVAMVLGLAKASVALVTNATGAGPGVFFSTGDMDDERSTAAASSDVIPLDFSVSGVGTGSNTLASGIVNLTSGTWFSVGFWYDSGNSRILYYTDDVYRGAAAITNLASEELSAVFGIVNEATGRPGIFEIDKITVVSER